MKEISPKFYQVVNDKLTDDALEMIENARMARRAAESCGCFQCQQWSERADRVCEQEADRLNHQPEMDHEEVLLMEYALSKIRRDDEPTH